MIWSLLVKRAAFAVLMAASFFAHGTSVDEKNSFYPRTGLLVVVEVSKEYLRYSVENSNKSLAQVEVPLNIESVPHLQFEDFNFDGYVDLSVWYLDEGMGVYTVHRIFIFNPQRDDFEEVFSSCGDDFLNVRIDKKRQFITSTVYGEDGVRSCRNKIKSFSLPRVRNSK